MVLISKNFLNAWHFENALYVPGDTPPKKVLFLSSFGLFNYSMDELVHGVKDIFNSNDIVFEIEFMDCQRLSDDERAHFKSNLIERTKLKNQKFDAVLIADVWAYELAMDVRQSLFGDIPIFFISVLNSAQAEYVCDNLFVSGVVENTPFAETIEAAIKFFPRAQTIYGIYDGTEAGQSAWNEFYRLRERFPAFVFKGINVSEHTRESFADAIGALGKNDILFSLFISENNNFEQNMAEYVLSVARIPVFSTNRHSIEQGFLGGKVIDYRSLGREGAKNVCRVLNGTEEYWNHLVFNRTESTFLFNKETLKKFGLKKSYIMPNADFVSRHFGFLHEFREFSFPFIIIIASTLLIIIVLCDFSQSLYRASRQDILTKLPNRNSVQHYLEKIISRGKPFSILLIDVLDFKTINDFNSYYCGDAVLRELAERLRGFSKTNKCFAARYDGDRFVLVYEDGHLSRNSPDIYYFRQVLSNPVFYYDTEIFIRTNIGIINSSPEYKTANDYLSNADIALNEAKKVGRGKYMFYSETMKNQISENSRISKIVDEACKTGAFKVLYQPQVDAHTGKLIGFEALVRLADSRLPPGVFIPVAEADGHIAKIGRIVTETVIKQLAEWKKKGLPLHCIAINYSAGQFSDKEYVNYLETLLKTYGVPSNLVHIEITESLFVGGKENALDLFNALDKIGVRLALDDFGTGYSSLSYLTYLPVETVKIDKSMVDTYLTDSRESFIMNVTNLVHSLGMKLTVEGVEYGWQYEKLRTFGADCIQGYFFSKPLSAHEVEEWSRRRV